MAITCWGDSLTAAGGMACTLERLAGQPVHNAGVGGEDALVIAARCNAMPLLLRPTGEPSTTGIRVQPVSSFHSGQPLFPLLQGSGVPVEDEPRGWAAGSPGRLRMAVRDPSAPPMLHGAGDRYEFVPDRPAVTLTRPTPFRYSFAEQHREDAAVLWLGQNGPDDATTCAMVEAFGQWQRGEWLVMTAVGAAHVGWAPLERRLQQRWGRRFLNVRRFLIDEALDLAGHVPTAGDADDVARGVVPRSLRRDEVHHTEEAQALVAEHLVWPRLQEYLPLPR